jgi:uncharacterized protein (TIGR02453 family)
MRVCGFFTTLPLASAAVNAEEAPSFSPDLFAFLRELKANNEREWFNANKGRYERNLKEPALAFIEDVGYRLPAVAPHLVADKRSMFRIYRDTRFAKDKTPYKTHVGIYFRHARSAEADTAGLYLHLEPAHVFLGAGIWHPTSPALKRIRDALVARPDEWRRAVEAVEPVWKQAEGETLKRPPAGYSADHPLIEDLKRKSFAITSPLSQKEVTAPGFLDECEARAGRARPFLAFLCGALGVEY